MNERRVPEALIGVYVATVLGPAVALWDHGTGAVSLPAATAGGALAGLVAAVAARRVDDLPARVASLRVAVVTVLPPLAYLPYMILATAPASAPAGLAVAGLLAIVPGVLVPVSGAVVQNRRLRTAATDIAVVTVGGEDDDGDGRNWPVIAGVTVTGLGMIVAGAAVALTGGGEFGTVTTGLGSVSTMLLLFANDDETELAVTDEGLRVDRSITRWDALAGYRVTDDEIKFVRPEWYGATRSFERAEIDDEDENEDALLEALAEFLPRLDERGRVEMAARRGELAG